jgi:hypothetical protein
MSKYSLIILTFFVLKSQSSDTITGDQISNTTTYEIGSRGDSYESFKHPEPKTLSFKSTRPMLSSYDTHENVTEFNTRNSHNRTKQLWLTYFSWFIISFFSGLILFVCCHCWNCCSYNSQSLSNEMNIL